MAKNADREEEPSGAPEPELWYDLRLGPSFRDHQPSSKLCTLRFDFKPASVDKTRPGSLRKRKDNRVTVEFQNNQQGKPKVMFEGITEDYKENDAVLFFDGETFCLERLHRAVKRLRYVRQPGESAATSVGKAAGHQFRGEGTSQVKAEKVEIADPELLGGTPERRTLTDEVEPHPPSTALPEVGNYESSEENVDIMDGEDDSHQIVKEEEDHSRPEVRRGIDINLVHQDDEEEDEIADVDASDDEVTGCNAAEALRAQVAGQREDRSSGSTSSSSSSESSSSSASESSSGSTGSESKSSNGDTITSI